MKAIGLYEFEVQKKMSKEGASVLVFMKCVYIYMMHG